MSYYRVCPECGACLDPGEVCDCRGLDAEKPEMTGEGQNHEREDYPT